MSTFVKKRFEALDSFRGICALLVVCYHVRILLSFTETAFFRNASYFVEFFFVLSGFVMFHTYGNTLFTKGKFKNYITSRFFRLYPMHFLMLLIVIIIEFVKLFAAKKGIIFNNAAFTRTANPSEFIPNLLLLHAWLPQSNPFSFNTVSWSISIEFYMYIIFAVILLVGIKMKNFFFAGIMLIAALMLFMNSGFVKYEALRGLYCFFAGCLSYAIYDRLTANRSRTFFTILELILIVSVVMAVTLNLAHKSLVVTFIFCITIITFAFEKGTISDLFKLRPFTFLGKLSYSIYITHFVIWFFFIAGAIIATKATGINFTVTDHSGPVITRFITTNNYLLDLFILIGLLGTVIVISSITYKYVESKGIAFGKRFRNNNAANKANITQQQVVED